VSKHITLRISVSALKSVGAIASVSALIVAGACTGQGMLQDYAADQVIKKFQGRPASSSRRRSCNRPPRKKKQPSLF
jgi:hypothetical protein